MMERGAVWRERRGRKRGSEGIGEGVRRMVMSRIALGRAACDGLRRLRGERLVSAGRGERRPRAMCARGDARFVTNRAGGDYAAWASMERTSRVCAAQKRADAERRSLRRARWWFGDKVAGVGLVMKRPCGAVPLSKPEDAASWSEGAFLRVADATLHSIVDVVDDAADEGVDAELAQGVLTIRLGAARGTFVLNTQTPNRQLWLSSPVSGPWRYNWHAAEREWRSTRDQHRLRDRLDAELRKLAHIELPLDEPSE